MPPRFNQQFLVQNLKLFGYQHFFLNLVQVSYPNSSQDILVEFGLGLDDWLMHQARIY